MEAEKKRAAWRLLPGTTGGCLINTDRTDGKVRIQKKKKKREKESQKAVWPGTLSRSQLMALAGAQVCRGSGKAKEVVGDEDGRRACG